MKKIYVGNLPYRTIEQDLESVFAKFGNIETVAVIKDHHSGRSKGFGFITFDSETAAQEALTMDGQDFQGRPLKVSIAKEKSESGPMGRRDRGGPRKNFRRDREKWQD